MTQKMCPQKDGDITGSSYYQAPIYFPERSVIEFDIPVADWYIDNQIWPLIAPRYSRSDSPPSF